MNCRLEYTVPPTENRAFNGTAFPGTRPASGPPAWTAFPADTSFSSQPKTPRILVVDDEPLVRNYIESGLRGAGYQHLLFGASGSAVPALAMREHPDLIIMDVMMAGGNGLRALRMLKDSPLTAAIPVIITSGFNIQNTGDGTPAWDCLLTKPFSASQLVAEVGRLLRLELTA